MKRARRILSWSAIALGLLGILLVVGLALFHDIEPPDDSDLFLARRQVADEDNGLLVLENDLDEDMIHWDEYDQELELSEMIEGPRAWDPGLAEKVLWKNARALEVLDRSLAKPDFVQVEPPTWDGYPLYDLEPLFNLVRVSQLRAISHLHEGDTGKAIDGALQIIALGHKLQASQGGGLSLHLIAVSFRAIGYWKLERIVTESEPDPVAMKRSLYELRNYEPDIRFLVEAYKSDYEASTIFIDSLDTWRNPLFRPNRTRARLAEEFREVIGYLEKGDFSEEWPNADGRASSLLLSLNPLSRQFLDTTYFPSLLNILLREKFRHRLAVLLLALRLYQADHGSLPRELADLVPDYLEEVPEDPWDRKPMKYSREKKLVYSVGEDRIDGGGSAEEKDSDALEDSTEPTLRIRFSARAARRETVSGCSSACGSSESAQARSRELLVPWS